MKVAVYSSEIYDKEKISAAAEGTDLDVTFFQHRLTPNTVVSSRGFDAVCLFVNDDAGESVIRTLAEQGVKSIALRCSGFNNVDLKTAAEIGIRVFRVPAYSPEAVAEHAVALIMTLNRKTHRAYNRVREGNFGLKGLTGFDLKGKTVGIVGTGRIGQAFAKIMKGFGCQLQASDQYPDDQFAAESGCRYVEFDELLATSDIVSLHCPLVEDTHHLINKKSLSMMKPGAMLINTGRGALVNSKAVVKALKSHHLGYLGIDVYEEESELFFEDRSSEIIQDDTLIRLMSFPNVLVTGHQGFFTHEALDAIAMTTVDNLQRFHQKVEPAPDCEVTIV